MNLRILFLPFGVVLAVLLLPAAHGAGPGDRLGAYDFDYEVSGDARARPVQVFDDGRSTYFQFKSGEPIPAIFAQTSAGAALQMPTQEGPYVKVPALAPAYALKLGYAEGRVAYLAGERARSGAAAATPSAVADDRAAAVASTQSAPASTPFVSGATDDLSYKAAPRNGVQEYSYATPLKGDTVAWPESTGHSKDVPVLFRRGSARLAPAAVRGIRTLVASQGNAVRYEVIGHDDDDHLDNIAQQRAGVVVNALVSAGVARASITSGTTAEVMEAGKGTSHGATVRVWQGAPPGSTTPAGLDMAQLLWQLDAGRITASQAIALVESARRRAPEEAVAAPAPAPVSLRPWAVRRSDQTIEQMLIRWGHDAGWRVVWQGAPRVAITGDTTLARSGFLAAADYVVSQAASAGYKLKATAYSNQTLVITGE